MKKQGGKKAARGRKASAESLPIPSHLAGWVAPESFEDEVVTASVRCPCGSDRLEFHHPGETHLRYGDGIPVPSSVKIGEEWFFIVKAVCATCRAEHVLFDSHFHGCNGFLHPGTKGAQLPRPRLWPWRCLACGSATHTGQVSIVEDYQDRYIEFGHARKFGADRWPDAFGWFNMSIQCCGCGQQTPGWVSYEAR
jgi:hypothetical protein